MSDDRTPLPTDENQLIAERREKLKALRDAQRQGGGPTFPNDFKPGDQSAALHSAHGTKAAEQLEAEGATARVAGRMVLKRVMGKASFATLQDGSGRIQIYVSNEVRNYEDFKHWDLGDVLGVSGFLFKTKTGELTIHATAVRLLVKALRPLPEKFHGMTDQELKYRQRYVDLIVSPKARETFETRIKVLQALRAVMTGDGYLEVETPMMQPIPGGAV